RPGGDTADRAQDGGQQRQEHESARRGLHGVRYQYIVSRYVALEAGGRRVGPTVLGFHVDWLLQGNMPRRGGRVVRQRSAKPRTAVQFRSPPPRNWPSDQRLGPEVYLIYWPSQGACMSPGVPGRPCGRRQRVDGSLSQRE